MIKYCFIFILALAFIFSSCKKDEEKNTYLLKGTVTDALNGQAISGARVEVEQQTLDGSTFGAIYNFASGGETNGSGSFNLEWEKANLVEARVTGAKAGYITRIYNLNASSFKPGEPVTQNLALFPEANIQIRVQKTGVNPNANALNFRFENAEFDCLCCNNSWRNFNNTTTDSTFTCRAYGDSWLRYRYEVVTGSNSELLRDSIFCQRNSIINLDIQW
jgi:hypothetical protein